MILRMGTVGTSCFQFGLEAYYTREDSYLALYTLSIPLICMSVGPREESYDVLSVFLENILGSIHRLVLLSILFREAPACSGHQSVLSGIHGQSAENEWLSGALP